MDESTIEERRKPQVWMKESVVGYVFKLCNPQWKVERRKEEGGK